MPLKTYVYVDGFNLYYGAVKGTSYKWLNIKCLCDLLLPKHEVVNIKYFTAHVSARMGDPDQPTRQQTFLRALRTVPQVEIILGHFLTTEVTMPLTKRMRGLPSRVRVIKTEEKGSDVNLASHLLRDAFGGAFEAAVLITNDSDLLEPVRIVREELGLIVGILNPHRRASRVLARVASFVKPIRKGALRNSQFAETLSDNNGSFRKPSTW